LKVLLNQPKGVVLGWLEAMWHFAGQYAQQGNIGRFTDAEIEAWIEWNGKPGELIASLTESKWLDKHPVHRLLVHDWHEHADKATKQSLGRKKLPFLTVSVHTPGARLEPTLPTSFQPCGPPVPGAVPVPEPVPGAVGAGQPAPPPDEIPEGLSIVQYRQFACDELGTAKSYRNQVSFQDAIEAIMRDDGVTAAKATAVLIRRGKDHPPEKGNWSFWVNDGGWKEHQARSDVPQSAWSDEAVAAREGQRDKDRREGYEMWQGMSESYRKKNPWTGPVPEGVSA
jgi:hypothetical protein